MAKNEENYQITKNLSEKKLKELCGFFKSRNLEEFTLVEGDLEITMKANSAPSMTRVVASPAIEIAPEKSPPSEEVEEKTIDGNPITASISGTFYSSPSPSDPPYVKVGDKIKKGDKVCIIEAMKVMNEIVAPFSGTVADILTENGKPVKQGEVIIIVK